MPPKLVELVDQVPKGLVDALRLDLHRVVIRGVLTKSRRDDDSHGHHGRIGFMTVLYLRFAPPLSRTRTTGEAMGPSLSHNPSTSVSERRSLQAGTIGRFHRTARP